MEILVFLILLVVFAIIFVAIMQDLDFPIILIFAVIAAAGFTAWVFGGEVSEKDYRAILAYECFKKEAKENYMEDGRISKTELNMIKRNCEERKVTALDELKEQLK